MNEQGNNGLEALMISRKIRMRTCNFPWDGWYRKSRLHPLKVRNHLFCNRRVEQKNFFGAGVLSTAFRYWVVRLFQLGKCLRTVNVITDSERDAWVNSVTRMSRSTPLICRSYIGWADFMFLLLIGMKSVNGLHLHLLRKTADSNITHLMNNYIIIDHLCLA